MSAAGLVVGYVFDVFVYAVTVQYPWIPYVAAGLFIQAVAWPWPWRRGRVST